MVKDGWKECSGDSPAGVYTENVVFGEVFNPYRSGVAQNAMLKALEIPKISLFAVFVFVPIPP